MTSHAPHYRQLTPLGLGLLVLFGLAEWNNPGAMSKIALYVPIGMIVIGQVLLKLKTGKFGI